MSYSAEWTAAPAVIGALLLLLIVPSFALIALAVVALGGLVALTGAVLALPYLLVRTVRRRLEERRRPTEGTGPIARTSSVPILANLTPARRSQ
jgi:hypothetical protein